MKKELALHFVSFLILGVLIILLKNYFLNLPLMFLFIVGGIIGTILPDIDHFIYVFYLNPHELTSQRVNFLVKKGQLIQTWNLLSSTRSERVNLILHTTLFQILFLILSFLVLTSSSSLLGRGLVIAFLLHLLVDEILDLKSTGSLVNWFTNIPITLDKYQTNIYLIFNTIIILIFGFLL